MIDRGTLVSETFAGLRASRVESKCDGMKFADAMVKRNPNATMGEWLDAITALFKSGRLDPDWPFALLVKEFDSIDPGFRSALLPMLGKKAPYALRRWSGQLPKPELDELRKTSLRAIGRVTI